MSHESLFEVHEMQVQGRTDVLFCLCQRYSLVGMVKIKGRKLARPLRLAWQLQGELTGTLVGNLVLIPSTSCFRVAVLTPKKEDKKPIREKKQARETVSHAIKAGYRSSSSVWKAWGVGLSQTEPWWMVSDFPRRVPTASDPLPLITPEVHLTPIK